MQIAPYEAHSRKLDIGHASLPNCLRFIFIAALALGFSGCGINTIPTLEEQAKGAWSQVQNLQALS